MKKATEAAAPNQVHAMRLDYNLNDNLIVVTAHTGESNSTYTPEDIAHQATFDVNAFPASFTTGSEDVTKSLAGYGLQKLLQDRTSQVTGNAKAKIEAMTVEAARLIESGQWSSLKERTASTKGRVDTTLAQAIAEIKGIPLSKAEASLKALDKDKRAIIAANPAVADIVARLKAESKDAEATDLADLIG